MGARDRGSVCQRYFFNAMGLNAFLSDLGVRSKLHIMSTPRRAPSGLSGLCPVSGSIPVPHMGDGLHPRPFCFYKLSPRIVQIITDVQASVSTDPNPSGGSDLQQLVSSGAP